MKEKKPRPRNFRLRQRIALIAAAGAAVVGVHGSASRADTVYLKSGRSLQGRAATQPNGLVVLERESTKIFVPSAEVERVEKERPARYHLERAEELAAKGLWDWAEEACNAAAQAGADPSRIAPLREAILRGRTKGRALAKGQMRPLAREQFESARELQDRGLWTEAAETMALAHSLDPENREILDRLLELETALFLRGHTGRARVEEICQEILRLDPEDAEARRIAAMAKTKELNREAERAKTIESLHKAILADYEKKRFEPEMLGRIRGLKSYAPEKAILDRIEKIEAEVRPIIMAKILQAQSAAEKSKRSAETPAANSQTEAAKGKTPKSGKAR